jgi:hypothetical protein
MTESDHKKAYQEFLKEKAFITVVIFFLLKIISGVRQYEMALGFVPK